MSRFKVGDRVRTIDNNPYTHTSTAQLRGGQYMEVTKLNDIPSDEYDIVVTIFDSSCRAVCTYPVESKYFLPTKKRTLTKKVV